jgi:hypothetical protein
LSLAPHTQEKIQAFPNELSDRKQIQRFLGCLNYIANEGFFKDLAKERKHLQKKISDKIPWSWSETDSNIVKIIKEKNSSFTQTLQSYNKRFFNCRN